MVKAADVSEELAASFKAVHIL